MSTNHHLDPIVVADRLLASLPEWLRRILLAPDMIRFVLFALVGCAAAIGHYGVLVLLRELFGVAPVPASACGFIVGGVISYMLNYGQVFRSDQAHLPTAGKFLTVAVVGLGFNSAVMWILAVSLGIHYLAAQVTATLTVMVWSYAGNRLWTFAAAIPER